MTYSSNVSDEQLPRHWQKVAFKLRCLMVQISLCY